jgi:hypothetical protein
MTTKQRRPKAQTSALLLLALTACSSDKIGPPSSAPVDWHAFDLRPVLDAGPAGAIARERPAAMAYVSALASPGFAQLTAVVGADCHFASPGMRDGSGREAVVQAHGVLLGALDSRSAVANRVFRTANTQIVEWTLVGRQARSWMGVKARGSVVVVKGVSLLWTRDDGRIEDVHVYFDILTVKSQLGVSRRDLISLPLPVAGDPPQLFDQTNSPDEIANVSLARGALDALESKNESAYVSAVSDDVELSTPDRTRAVQGKAEWRSYFLAMHKSVGQLDTTVANAWGIAKFAIVEYTISGAQRGAFGGEPGHDDAVLRLHVVDIVEMRGGLINKLSRYENLGELGS